MSLQVRIFDYHLPKTSIAQCSVYPRDTARLLCMDKMTGAIAHKHVFDIGNELRPGDVLVFNVTKVFRARLVFPGGELFVLKVEDGGIEALIRPGKKFPVGSLLSIKNTQGETIFTGKIVEKTATGVVRIHTGYTRETMMGICEAYGSIPTPPYIETPCKNDADYQTVYAKNDAVGSVAAPTAGLHFTPELLQKIKEKGVEIVEVMLHVGLGTFRPVQVEHVEDHVMHEEYCEISAHAAERITQAKCEGRRVIAVGTTTTRVLEGVAMQTGEVKAFSGNINIFITPGFTFRVIDGLMTNFHLPKSTLLMLVCAFAGTEHVLGAYRLAVLDGYRFFSFGDAMLIT